MKTDTDRLNFLIAKCHAWNPLGNLNDGSTYGGYWDDGNPNYGAGGDAITPEGFEDPRAAIDAALDGQKLPETYFR